MKLISIPAYKRKLRKKSREGLVGELLKMQKYGRVGDPYAAAVHEEMRKRGGYLDV